MIGGPRPELKRIDEYDGPPLWVCGCAACVCDSHAFVLRADGSVLCERCRHPVPQLEVHIIPNLKRKS